jgi:hypothetical protein
VCPSDQLLPVALHRFPERARTPVICDKRPDRTRATRPSVFATRRSIYVFMPEYSKRAGRSSLVPLHRLRELLVVAIAGGV